METLPIRRYAAIAAAATKCLGSRVFAFSLVIALFCAQSKAVDGLRIVAVSDDPMPGGGRFSGISTPRLNEAGSIIFRGTTTSGLSRTWYYDRSNELKFVAGDVGLPALPLNGTITSSNAFDLNRHGEVSVRSTIFGNGINTLNNEVVWLFQPGSPPKVLAHKGQPLPEQGTDLVLGSIFNSYVNDAGQVIFDADFIKPGEGTASSYGTILVNPDGNSKIFSPRLGAPVPGYDSNVTFRTISVPEDFNNRGQRVVTGYLEGPGFDPSNDRGYWLADDEDPPMHIAQNGTAAPGTEEGVVFHQLANYPALNSLGDVAYTGSLRGPGISSTNNHGLWVRRTTGEQMLIARSGTAAPGIPGASFTGFADPVINDKGQLAFVGFLSGALDHGLWMETARGQFALVQQAGIPAPGVDEPVYLSRYELNDAGRVAFMAFIGDSTGRQGIWAQDGNGELKLIVKSGDAIDVNRGPMVDLRTVSDVYFWEGFNDSGHVAFALRFTDRTEGVFISDLVAVPEPSSIVWFAFVALACMRRGQDLT